MIFVSKRVRLTLEITMIVAGSSSSVQYTYLVTYIYMGSAVSSDTVTQSP